ncbi:MAG: rRNA maturation RNase YbeY [Clostridia bacterium]|nr:rRNA maturation RNase YbeY [Clostridia bacterium]
MKVILTNKTQSILPNAKTLQKVGKYILKEQRQPTWHISVGVFFVGADEMQEINNTHRHVDKPTDVISFRLIDNPEFKKLNRKNFPLDYDKANHTIYIGEIFICDEIAREQAKEWGHTMYREAVELFCHGMLHVLGYDHEQDQDRKIMKEHEETICAQLDKLLKCSR